MSYSIKEIADKMGVTTATLRYWDTEGLLPNVNKVNGRRVFEDKEWYYETAIKAGTESAVENVTSIAPTLEVDKIPKKYKEVNK